jgi:hypothetical protein
MGIEWENVILILQKDKSSMGVPSRHKLLAGLFQKENVL